MASLLKRKRDSADETMRRESGKKARPIERAMGRAKSLAERLPAGRLWLHAVDGESIFPPRLSFAVLWFDAGVRQSGWKRWSWLWDFVTVNQSPRAAQSMAREQQWLMLGYACGI